MSRQGVTAGDWELELLPELGGAIAALRFGGRDILRPTPFSARSELETACFPLVPYANRIGHGRFVFAGRETALRRNFGDHPHPIHGPGWQRPWTLLSTGSGRALLRYVHDGDADWPWSFIAEQHFELSETGLSLSLSVRVTAGEAMPAGLGFHPYFPRTPDSRVHAAVSGVWLTDESQLPVERVPGHYFGDLRQGLLLHDRPAIDHAFDGWDGKATIAERDRLISLAAENCSFVQLLVPADMRFFCVEPVSHLPDAVNLPGGMTCLGPRESMTIRMRISGCAVSPERTTGGNDRKMGRTRTGSF